jgi:hypothetical protein
MKKIKSVLLITALTGVLLSQTGCLGSFQLTKNMYEWNTTQINGQWGQELVFAAFLIIPVYEVCLLADGVVLNTIEFWTGENPISMKPGEKESKIVQSGDDIYRLTAEKNRVHIKKTGGENQGKEGEFVFDSNTSSWSYNNIE